MKQVVPLTITSGMSQTGSYILTLCEPESGRQVPIVIGEHEASAILLAQSHTPTRRPTTHETMKGVMQAFDLTLAKVSIDRMEDGIFYATLHLNDGFNTKTVDSRSSDAVALAMLCDKPIEMAESIIEQCGVKAEPRSVKQPTAEQLEAELQRCIEEEDYERAAELQAKIERLRS